MGAAIDDQTMAQLLGKYNDIGANWSAPVIDWWTVDTDNIQQFVEGPQTTQEGKSCAEPHVS